MTSIAADLAKLELPAKVELLEIDAALVGGPIYRVVNQISRVQQPIVWQGNTYSPMPIEASGFEVQSDGPMPRPRLVIGNVLGLVGVVVRQYQRLDGCKVTRKRTLSRYLDAVNFPGAINASADPTAHYPDEVWYFDRIVARDKTRVEWELASPLDLPGLSLPRCQIQARTCAWKYRGSECGYTGGAVATAQDVPTANMALDRCSHLLSGCKLRFGANAELPFGGFPGAGLLRQA